MGTRHFDARRGDGKRFVVRADEKLTGFMELESAICAGSGLSNRDRALKVRPPAYKAWFANPNQINRVMLKSSLVHVLLTLSITVRVVMRDGAQ